MSVNPFIVIFFGAQIENTDTRFIKYGNDIRLHCSEGTENQFLMASDSMIRIAPYGYDSYGDDMQIGEHKILSFDKQKEQEYREVLQDVIGKNDIKIIGQLDWIILNDTN